ncbi:VCBS repeat-containing protein [Paenibacillus psychroresistens]|uniref:VCBS repeat-containing protein n=1 Tax=Paenibacillus psychroresistens TaxID=1778678 RepID=A0A6B8RV81_9BACL|nr:VCBS repeat-containing protein [Paenibacillus psychroresistens]QGQ99674.1 VCBS repeat-containing protein [Paenibacillus psychroresistens]
MNRPHNNLILLDMKQADVNGDGIIDHVYLYGNKADDSSGGFTDHITLIIQNGHSHTQTTVNLPNNAGYNGRLFLGDFNKDKIADILVTIDSGGSGGYISAYVYSFKNNVLRRLFDVDSYNSYFQFDVHFEDYYRVSIRSPQLDVLFILDISNKGHDYLAQYYNENGTLKTPTTGGVLALGALYPIATDLKTMNYDLLALQRIIGTVNADTLGYVENLLTWDNTHFIPARLAVSILPSKLIAHY